MEHTELSALIDALEADIARAEAGEIAWRDVWDRIRRVGDGFRGIRFPSREEHVASWTRFRSLVDRAKERQDAWRAAGSERVGPLLARIDALAAAVTPADGRAPRWKECWEEVRLVGEAFRGTPFPAREDRSAAWARFQEAVAALKAAQERERAARKDQAPRSRRVAAALLQFIASARPLEPDAAAGAPAAAAGEGPADGDHASVGAGGGGAAPGDPVVPEGGGDDESGAAAIPAAPPRTRSLKECSARLRDARRLFGEHREALLPPDRRTVFEAMKETGEVLDAAWARWKESRTAPAPDGSPAVAVGRGTAWEARQRENAVRLEDRIARLREVEVRKARHIEELRGKQRGARGGDFRARIDAWLAEEEEAMASVREKLAQLEGWLAEARARLGGQG